MIHQLPTEAQLPGGDHFRVDRVVEHVGGSIHIHGTYGTLDGDGNFVAADYADQNVAISDRGAFDAEASKATSAPDVRADPLSHMKTDVLDFIDSHALWPGQ